MSKLINGKIPANTECPWKDKCSTALESKCNHKGLQHDIPFSCGFARGFAICERNRGI